MATYYVRKTGSDAAAGTSAGAAWLTIGKALGASGIASGDTVYIGAGIYREIVSVAMTSATAETKVVGDVSGVNTGDAGEVIWSAHVTDDVTAPVSGQPLSLNGRDFLTFENLTFYGGTATCVLITTSHSTDWKFTRCAFLSYLNNSTAISYTAIADTACNGVIDSCGIFGFGGSVISLSYPTSASADYNSNLLIKNTVIIAAAGNPIIVNTSGSGSFKGGGITIYNCSLEGGTAVRTVTANISTTYPVNVYNCLIMAATALNANTSGQIVEDYNLISATTARTNVTAGGSSQVNKYAPGYQGIRPALMGTVPLIPVMMPTRSSPLLGFGAQSGGPSIDITGANRPSGGASTAYAVGAYERGNFGTKETSVTHAGAASLKLTGPGYQDFQVPVDASSTTVTIYARYDTNHATTNKPQISVLNGGECGVSDATATMTSAVDTWEALALTFTPTAKGIVTIRCISRSAAGNGIAYFDS